MASILGREKVHAYCTGFLDGVLMTLRNERLACPDEDDLLDSSFLLSVLNSYLEDAQRK